MGSLFVGTVLVSMHARPAKAVPDVELQPVEPGAWAAWAKSYADEQARTAAGTGDRAADNRIRKLAFGSRHG